MYNQMHFTQNSSTVKKGNDKKEIKIGTLNYSGILLSPFQFFQNKEGEESEISKCFYNLLNQKQKNEKFKWSLGKIDQKFQKGRYTPIYYKDAGIIGNKLINKPTFQNKWKQYFQMKESNKTIASKDQINNCLAFDFHCYRTLVYYLYKLDIQLGQIPEDPRPYAQLMQKYFRKQFLNQSSKLNKVTEAINKFDIFFIQQATLNLISNIGQHCKDHNLIYNKIISSLIVARRNLFQEIQQNCDNIYQMFEQQIKIFNNQQNRIKKQQKISWLQDSVIFRGSNIIFICVHLSSKKEKNQPQIRSMMQSIHHFISNKQNQGTNIVICGDVNSSLLQQKKQDYKIGKGNNLRLFPDNKQIPTSIKKRTMLQAQINKALQEVKECKDSIISTLPLTEQQVISITGSKVGRYLPNEDHPFDHYIVKANINIA